MDLFKKLNKISAGSRKNRVLTNEEISRLRAVVDSAEREKLVKKYPYILPYVLNIWSTDRRINTIVKKAIEAMPENVLKLGKGKIVPTPELVNLAIAEQPNLIFEMNDELKAMISAEGFIYAFAQDPEICACDVPVLKKVLRDNVVVERGGKKYRTQVYSTVRNECLKAIRLAMGVSEYHTGFDDFASDIAEVLKYNKVLKKYQTQDKMATKLPTVVNALIKNQDIRIYAMPVEVWKLNNYKPLYLAVKESVKQNSNIRDILEFIPFDLLPENVTKKVVAMAILKRPELWCRLEQYNLEYLKEDTYIQYVTYKSCKKNNRMDIVNLYFTDEQTQKATAKYNGVIKRAQTRMKRAKTTRMLTKVFKPILLQQESELTM